MDWEFGKEMVTAESEIVSEGKHWPPTGVVGDSGKG